MNRHYRIILALFCGALLAVSPEALARSQASFPDRVLAVHNGERIGRGLPPLAWSDSLAREAAGWARILAREGRMRHASQQERRSHGENLWMGSAGYYPVEAMVGAFLDERRYFRAGKFPRISKTGNWRDAAHYTQVIWPRTQRVGCAIATARGNDFLVCRYDPSGNWVGEYVG